MVVRKKSLAKKKLAGTVENSRVKQQKPPANQVQTPKKLPPTFKDPPTFLGPVGIKIFNDIAIHVNRHSPLYNIDSYIVGQAAKWMEIYIHALEKIKQRTTTKKDGFVMEYSSGAMQISPYVTLADKAEQNIRRYFEVLGIGPKSRENLGGFNQGGGQEDESDPFNQMMKMADELRKSV